MPGVHFDLSSTLTFQILEVSFKMNWRRKTIVGHEGVKCEHFKRLGHCNLKKSKLQMFVTQLNIQFFGKHNQQGLRVINNN